MTSPLQISADVRRSKSASVAPHTRAKPPRFSPAVIAVANQMIAELAAEDAEYVQAVADGLTEAFPGDRHE